MTIVVLVNGQLIEYVVKPNTMILFRDNNFFEFITSQNKIISMHTSHIRTIG